MRKYYNRNRIETYLKNEEIEMFEKLMAARAKNNKKMGKSKLIRTLIIEEYNR